MTEDPTRIESIPQATGGGAEVLPGLELPALRVVEGYIVGGNTRSLELFGPDIIGREFEGAFHRLKGAPVSNGDAAEQTLGRVKAREGKASGRRYAVHWQSETIDRERVHTAVLFDITRDSRLEEALAGRLQEVTRAHRAGKISSWELDIKRLRFTIPHKLPSCFGSVLRAMPFEEVAALFHPDDLGAMKSAIRRAVDSGSLQLTSRLVDAKGREHTTLFRGEVTKDRSGVPLTLSGVAIGLPSEIESSNEMEEQLALQLTLLDHLADGVVRVDEDGIIVAVNSAAERMTRWQSSEALGRPVESVVHLVDDRTGVRLPTLPEGERQGGLNSRLIRRDGTELPVRSEVRRLESPSGPTSVIELRDLSELRGLESQMLFRATHDGLTGLFDRVEFERRLGEALSEARSEGHVHALCYVDLDNFKIINDTCGHMAGDEMLKQIGSLLRCNFRGSDTLGRLGGDEFGVLLTDCPEKKARDIARSLCKDIKMFRFSWDDKVFNVTASVGLVSIDGQAASVAEVLGAADGACYIAKQNGANRVEVYRPDDSALSKRRDQLKLVQVVQNALSSDAFELYGQQIKPLYGSERPIIELLLRMRNEKDEVVLPGEFMRVAEVHGLAVMIDRWVMNKALRELAKHGDEPGFHGAAFAINLSGQSLGDETFLQYVLEEFETSRIDPSRVYFEITETAAISNLGRAMRFITELRGRGSVFVLDDFGAGLSSFGYLRNLPVGLIKIDGQFVKGLTRDPIQRALVEAINQIGQVMQMKTVAESVEDEATLRALRAIKVDYAQGFHVARPAPLRLLRDPVD